MFKDAVEDSSVLESNDAAYVVSVVAIAAENLKRSQFRDSDLFVIAISPNLIAVWVVLRATCGTAVVNFGASRIADVPPSFIVIEQIVGTFVEERAGNKFRNQSVVPHKNTVSLSDPNSIPKQE
jgi:hypothetical protein